MVYVTRHRLYLSRDMQHVVGEGHPDAAVLFAAPGGQLEDHQVETLGIAALEAALDAAQPPLPDAGEADEDDQPEEDEEGDAGESAPAEEPAGAGARGGKQVTHAQVEDKAIRAPPQRRAPPKSKPRARGR